MSRVVEISLGSATWVTSTINLLEVERSVAEDSTKPDIAKSMLVFMVRGLFTPMEFPYAQFATKDLMGELISGMSYFTLK